MNRSEALGRLGQRPPLLLTASVVVYTATIPAANWMISNVGEQTFPGGPHVIPVGFGYDAPSGVLMIGFALFARDMLQRLGGRSLALIAIAVGVVVSYIIADPAIATASAVAFALGELADFAVYTPLARRRLALAVLASGVVGGVIDSLVFLQMAFGSTAFWQGQVIGKTYIAALAGVAIWTVQKCATSRGRFPLETTYAERSNGQGSAS